MQAQVYSPTKLTSQQLKKISKFLQEKYSLDPQLVNVIDKNILAGVKIIINDLVLDLTLNNKLQQLRKAVSL